MLANKSDEDTKEDKVSYNMFYYPEPKDPGIENIFHKNDEIFTDNIQYYKNQCELFNVKPRKMFLDQINEKHIDLKNCMIPANEMIAIFESLTNSTTLESIDLSHNFIAIDTCLIFENFFSSNSLLFSINLTGCRLGPNGLKPLVKGLVNNHHLKELILTSNFITDKGIEILTPIILNNPIKKYDLSKNELTFKSGLILSKIINVNEEINELDLSWNTIDGKGMRLFLIALWKNKSINKLNISWNGLAGPEFGLTLKQLIQFNRALQYLDLSNNRLARALLEMSIAFPYAKSVETLKFGNNPLNLSEALEIMKKICFKRSSIKVFNMEYICVTPKFVNMFQNAKKLPLWKDIEVIYGDVIGDYQIFGPDAKKLIMKRAAYIGKTIDKRDFRTFLLKLPPPHMTETLIATFRAYMNLKNIHLENDLFRELCNIFKGKKKDTVDVIGMIECVKTIWPDLEAKLLKEMMSESSSKHSYKYKYL